MGSVVQATCAACGLARDMVLGSGFASYLSTCAVPAGCRTCRRLVIVDARAPAPHACPTRACHGIAVMLGELVGAGIPGGGAFVFDWRIDADSTYLLAAGPHTCPACGRASLNFGLTGSWD
jgi:hypothetical protein